MALTWTDDELPDAQILREVIEWLTASTYPTKTLSRRIKLLTKKEKKRCDKLWLDMCKNCEEIDNIISERAEIEQDKWP